MTKVTITAQPQGNALAKTPGRAAIVMNSALAGANTIEPAPTPSSIDPTDDSPMLIRDNTGAWAAADAARTRLRDKLEAMATINEDLSPEEDEELGKASVAFIRLPAPDLSGMLRKAEEELVDHCAVFTIDEALAQLDQGDIHDAWRASVYRDLKHLATAEQVSPSIAADVRELERHFSKEKAQAAIPDDEYDEAAYEAAVARTGSVAHRMMATPAKTLTDFRAKARAVAWALSDDWDVWTDTSTFSQFGKRLIQELLAEDLPAATWQHPTTEQANALMAEAWDASKPYCERMTAEMPLLQDLEEAADLEEQYRATDDEAEEKRLIHAARAPRERSDRVRARTINGLMARARLASLLLPRDPLELEYPEWRVMRSLIDDVASVYREETPPPVIIGPDACSTRFIAARALQKLAPAQQSQLLAAE